jgi:hypothetical protein
MLALAAGVQEREGEEMVAALHLQMVIMNMGTSDKRQAHVTACGLAGLLCAHRVGAVMVVEERAKAAAIRAALGEAACGHQMWSDIIARADS